MSYKRFIEEKSRVNRKFRNVLKDTLNIVSRKFPPGQIPRWLELGLGLWLRPEVRVKVRDRVRGRFMVRVNPNRRTSAERIL